MDRTIPMLLIGLIFGGGIGFVTAAGNGITFDGHDHSDPTHNSAVHSMDHDTPLVLSADNAPTLAVDLLKDPTAGYNLHIKTSNFAFSPQNASKAHVPGEGHAHVYVNGRKIVRHYSPWLHIEALPKGAEVKVTLNANSHQPLMVGDKLVEVRTIAPSD